MTEVPDDSCNRRSARSAETEQAYERRFRQLESQALYTVGAPLTAQKLAAFLVDRKRPDLAPASWRHYRASMCFGLAQYYHDNPAELQAALARLGEARAEPKRARALKTSARKAKRFGRDDITRICHAALATRSASARPLALYLQASNICGLRPREWIGVTFRRSKLPDYQWEMIVKTAKHDDRRGHGPTRTLRWSDLSEHAVGYIRQWIDVASEAVSAGAYPTLIGNMSRLMYDVTRELFPRRTSYPAMYTPRHECAARWKAHYLRKGMSKQERLDGLARIAALLGHASDATATEHYGRPRRGENSSVPIPHPDPAEVKKVRRKFKAAGLRMENTNDHAQQVAF